MARKTGYRDAAVRILKQRGPMHYRELAEAILSAGLVETTAATPEASLNAMIAVDIKLKGKQSAFVRVKPGVFALRGIHTAPTSPVASAAARAEGDTDGEADDEDVRVRTPLFPTYREVRHLLRIWPGRPRKQVTGLAATIAQLRGTPQSPVDWTEPDVWIPERLSGSDRELAAAIWTQSKGAVNPRHTRGHWMLANRFGLLADAADGSLGITDVGRDFLDHPGGDTEAAIDGLEGLLKLLTIVSAKGPARAGALRHEWADYLERRSRFGTESTIKGTLRRRLNNLLDRGLIERRTSLYSTTSEGLAYLQRAGDDDDDGLTGERHDIWTLVRQQETSVRDALRELLLDMDPFAFEHLIKRLLEEMDYENVEVTSKSGDGGVDVVADIELGITAVREVVQAKRHRRTIQRKDLDALRGSLYRFNAVRGTIVTTSRFAKGTREAAFATGAAPITLIDGDKLIDLLIEHGIGVRKRTIELLEVDAEALADVGQEA